MVFKRTYAVSNKLSRELLWLPIRQGSCVFRRRYNKCKQNLYRRGREIHDVDNEAMRRFPRCLLSILSQKSKSYRRGRNIHDVENEAMRRLPRYLLSILSPRNPNFALDAPRCIDIRIHGGERWRTDTRRRRRLRRCWGRGNGRRRGLLESKDVNDGAST